MTTALQEATRVTGPEQSRLLTRTEAAELLGVSVRTIDRLAAEGALPRIGRGRLVRYRTADVLAAPDRRPDPEKG